MPEIRHKAEIYVNYDEAQTRQNLSSGEEIRTVFGKIKKWFADMGTAAFKDVPSSGDAGNSEVVLGNDSRLSDARTPTVHNQAANTITAMTGYTKPQSTSAISTSDTLNGAVGKLEKGLDTKANTSDIPTVNDGTLTIQQNGTTKATFTANQAGNATVNIETGDAYGIDMYDDTLPIDITVRGDNLEDWVIYGNNEPGKNLVNLANVPDGANSGIEWTVNSTNGTITANGKMTGSIYSVNTVISPTDLSTYNGYYLSCDTENRYDAFIALRDASTYAFYAIAKSNESVLISNVPSTACYLQIGIQATIGTEISNFVFKPMIRAANTTPDFDPYHLGVGELNSAGTGYELPIITKQTGKADITTNIYLGTSPLTEGQSLSKEQATTKDIPTYNGECTIDTSYPNKPKMEIIPTDSAINIIEKLRRIGASNGSSSTVRTIYAPDDSNGIRTTVGNNRTEVQVACGQASNANAKFIATQTGIQGGVGTANQNNPNYLFHDDCVEDKIGRTGSGIYAGKAQPGSTLDLWYETAKLNGKKILTDDDINSWRDLQMKVRKNDMADIDISDQYTCSQGSGELTWDVIGKNIDTPADPNRTNTLTLRVHNILPEHLVFDAPEAFYACLTSALNAGTYNYYCFDEDEADFAYFTFTLTQSVPVGGQLVSTRDNSTLYSYASGSSTTPIETVSVTKGSSGTNLGTIEYYTRSGNLNADNIRYYGSNDWKESAIRQWLNSNKPAGQWWTPQNPWDRPPAYAEIMNGFMYDLDPEFLDVIGKTQVTTNYFDTSTGALNGTYTTEDYFFLMSQSQVSSDFSGEGTKYTPYSDNASRVMYKNGGAQNYWLRTPDSMRPESVNIVNSIGKVGSMFRFIAVEGCWVVPACNLI